uniref:Small ribosomal subunit protein uS3m n=1 Tax=Pleurotus pulmonarius TaxID=28995 RepID=A0A2U8LKN1_PLEPU|nr:hypothetical protein MN721_mgp10 [Pleurotus pulmonarius]AWL21264.1 hypothetical protein [Pleurotus pulmonarius]QBS47735.1 hypothetical protein [Pleurotus pulmonarius]QCP68318.1 rps3 [Pleurotus pulmonarius]UKQ56000.1 hypothetical protein [Pleurotus pulmonarius]
MNNSENTHFSTKILPLFGDPILKKTTKDRMLNKYNMENLNANSNLNKKTNSKIIKLSNVLGLYLKGLNIYNFHLNNYINNNNNKDLILHLKNQQKQTTNIETLNNNRFSMEKENTFNTKLSTLLKVLNKYINITDSNQSIKNLGQKKSNKNNLNLDINLRSLPSESSFLSNPKKSNLLQKNRKIQKLQLISNFSNLNSDLKSNKSLNLGLNSENNYKENFSSLALSQKIIIKNSIVNSKNDLIKDSDNLLQKLINTRLWKKLISPSPILSVGSTEVGGDKSEFVFQLNGKNGVDKIKLLNSLLHPSSTKISKITSKSYIKKLIVKGLSLGILSRTDLSNSKNIKIKGLNLLEIILSSIIAINILNSKISLKRKKIRLLKYINLASELSRSNSNNQNSQNISLSYLKNKNNLSNYSNKNNFIIPIQNKNIPVVYNNKLVPIINQYIKSMTIFNMKNKGSIFSYSSIIGFNFLSKNNKLIKNVYKFLSTSFYSMYCLISKPVFVITPDKIIIQLFYYLFIPNLFKFKIRNRKKFFNRLLKSKRAKSNRNFFNNQNKFRFSNKFKYKKIKKAQRKIFRKLSNISLINLYPNKFKKICLILSRFFKKPVELDLIRLHYPYNDSNILVNLLGIMINKIKIRIIIRKLFRKAIIKNPNKLENKNLTILPSFLSGMNIRIAGRLLTQKVVPRMTVKTIRRGVLAKSKVNFSDVARLTKKNKRGAFSITISSGQNFK